MRRFVSAIVLVGIISPASALGAMSRVDLQTAYQNALQQAITLLMQEVSQLEAQLAALTANQATGSNGSAIACTQEAMRCPDGSYVGRTGSACAFAACPAASSSVKIATSTVGTATSSLAASSTLTLNGSNTNSGITAATVAQNGKMPLQKIGTITIGASNAGPIELASLKLTFSGNGYTAGGSTFLNTVSLRDPNAVDVVTSFGAAETKDVNAGTIAWTFPTSANNLPVISPGTQLTLQLWAETDVIPGVSGTAESLSAIVQNPNDLTFYDGSDPTAIAIGPMSLSITETPVTVTSLSWDVGM